MEIEFVTQIDPERRRHVGHAALAFLAADVLALILVGLFFPPLWFCLAGALIPMGVAIFSKYRKMRHQEQWPDTLRIQEEKIIYLSKGKINFTIELAQIARIEAYEGLKIFTKGPARMTGLGRDFSLSKFVVESRRQKCDLFFPWFDASVKLHLENIVHTNQTNHPSRF